MPLGQDEVRQCCGFVAQIGPRNVDIFVLWTVRSLESQSWLLKINNRLQESIRECLNFDVTN